MALIGETMTSGADRANAGDEFAYGGRSRSLDVLRPLRSWSADSDEAARL